MALSALGGLLILLGPLTASAQEAPAAEAATAGEAVVQPTDEHADDELRLTLTAGGTGAYGNSQNIALNLAGNFTVREGIHSFVAEVGYVLGLTAVRDPMSTPVPNEFGPLGDSANNLTARMRYDVFLTPDDALYIVAKARRDTLALLEPRIGAQVGYARNFLREENHRFWGEIGYDLTYDNFGNDVGGVPRLLPIGNGEVSNDRVLNSLRLFIGYTNHINAWLNYDTGFEALMRFDRPEHWRFEWTNSFRSAIAEWLQLSVDITGRLDSQPPGQAEAWNEQPGQATTMFDLLMTVNLVGTFDLQQQEAVEEEEEEEVEEAVEEAIEQVCPECNCPEPEPCPEAQPEPEPEPEPAVDGETATDEATDAADAAAE